MEDECHDFYLDPKDLRLALEELAHLWNYMAYLNKIEGGKKVTGPGILSKKTISTVEQHRCVQIMLPADDQLISSSTQLLFMSVLCVP